MPHRRRHLPLLAALLLAALPAGAVPHFTEVAADAGLDYVHGFDGQPSEPLVISGGVAAGDVDGDGFFDLYAVRGTVGPNLLFRNRGDGTFEEVGAAAGVAIDGEAGAGPTFADVDGDRRLDLLLGGVGGASPRVFHNLGRTASAPVVFEEVTDRSGLFSTLDTYSAAFGDYDRDGDLDLFLAHWWYQGDPIGAPHLWRNDGTGRFSPADFSAGIAPVYLEEDRSFTPTFTDLDADGWPDLVVAGDFGTSQLFRNRGDGTFEVATTPVISDENGMGSAVGDYDNDGDLDWFVSSIWDPDGIPGGNWGVTGNRLYRNASPEGGGEIVLEDATDDAGVRRGYWGWGSCFADFDNDGDLDLFHTNGFPAGPEFDDDPARLFLNRGDGTFEERAEEAGVAAPGQGRGVVCFDFDRDGDLDLFVAQNRGRPLLFRNDGEVAGTTADEVAGTNADEVAGTADGGHYLAVRLRGAPPNTEGIGARITVTAGGRSQLREIRAGSNFVSQNPAEAHFGLGDATVVDELRVLWPDGTEEVRQDVAADRLVVLGDGDPPPVVEIPTLGPGGLLAVALLLAAASLRAIRCGSAGRRRRAPPP